MKKIIIASILAMMSFNAFAMEANVRVGFDFYRTKQYIRYENIPQTNKFKQYDKGFTIGAEIFPYTNKYIGIGAGVEYNFGVKTLKMKEEGSQLDDSGMSQVPINPQMQNKEFYQIPVYGVLKVNAYDFGDKKGAIYVPLRLGYSISNNQEYKGVYYGASLGYENGPLLVEATYNGTYSNACVLNISWPRKSASYIKSSGGGGGGSSSSLGPCLTHRAGVRLGYKFGEKKTKKETTNGNTINIIVSPVVSPEISPTINPKVSTNVDNK